MSKPPGMSAWLKINFVINLPKHMLTYELETYMLTNE